MSLIDRPTTEPWPSFHREQLASLARATPASMAGFAINTTIALWAFYTIIPNLELLIWAAAAYTISGVVGLRALRRRPRKSSKTQSPWRTTTRPWQFAILVALPWSILASSYTGSLDSKSDIILVVLAVGMAASGSVLIAPIPSAAILYMSVIIVPLAFRCMFLIGDGTYIELGLLLVSYWFFLLGLIATTARFFAERIRTMAKLEQSLIDLSKAHRETELAAMTDGLTGLANRRAFIERLKISESNIGPRKFAVIYMDLDRFKHANDALGHHVGDELLRTVGCRIQRAVNQSSIVARIGGDEFAVLLEDATDRSVAEALAERLLSCLSEPIVIEGHTIDIGVSIGVAISDPGGLAGRDILKQADIAMYAAKVEHKGICFFDPQMQRRVDEQSEIEMGLRTAIDRGELVVHYQPICKLSSNTAVGCEALVRWVRPDGTICEPDTFLPVAESMGLTSTIDRWVMQKACEQALEWPAHISVSVNFTAAHIMSKDVVAQAAQVLRETGLEPHRLQIEITETSLLKHTVEVAEIIRDLKFLGISIALDDFGTGYSSLSHLVSLSVDRIKVDRLFVSELDKADKKELVIKAIVQLARGLGADVVAEGIETEDQLLRVRACGVALGQGFFLSEPMSGPEATRWLNEQVVTPRQERCG
jgi:diguanylate cyclase (GGDEF)-like protein